RFHGIVRGHRTDDEAAAVLPDTGQPGNLSEIDQMGGPRQAELHGGQEAVAAREELGVVLMLAEKVERLFDAARRVVVELSWVHARGPPYFFARAAWTVFQTRSAVSGIVSMWSTPSPDSASTTALTTAGVAAIVPVSPAPLMPSGFTGVGVSVRSVSYMGSMSALGRA